jgi:hypothetical protein
MSEGQARFNYVPLATYLCQQNGVSDVHLIEPFRNRVEAHTIPRKTALQLDFKTPPGTKSSDPLVSCCISSAHLAKNKGPQPPNPFVHPKLQVPMPHDMNAVCVYNVTCRHYELISSLQQEENESSKIVYAVRLNFLNDHMAALQKTHEMRKMHAATGAVKGAFAYLTPTPPGGKDINEIPMPELEFGYQNEQFTKTFMLLNEQNIQHGVVVIPRNVCIASGLPVWRGQAPEPDERMLESMLKNIKLTDPKEKQAKREELITEYKNDFNESFKDDKKSTFFYAVPRKHVIAWIYGSETFMAQGGIQLEQFRFMHPTKKRSKLLYYLVPNATFEECVSFFKKAFLNKVDKKPLANLGFEFLPVETPKDQIADVSISLKAFFTYYSIPSLNAETINNLAPTLCKDFPLCHNWSKDEMEAQIAIQQARLQQEGKLPTKKLTKKN